jgi:murein DD-endopeptidase MepM/ murein hydrolase activator NlpD
MRLLFLFLISSILLSASIDTKINKNKKLLQIQKKKKLRSQKEVKAVVYQIKKQEKELNRIEKLIQISNGELQKHIKKFKTSKKNVKFISKNQKELLELKKSYENQLINLMSKNLSLTTSIELNEIKNEDDIINEYVYENINEITKKQIDEIKEHYESINKKSKSNLANAKKLKLYISRVEKKQVKYRALLKLHNKRLQNLKVKHKLYQDRLENSIEEQNNITSLLGNLNILKKEKLQKAKAKRLKKIRLAKLKKEKARKLKQKREKRYKKSKNSRKTKYKSQKPLSYRQLQKAKFIDKMDVRLIGSSSRGVKIRKYYGKKTIAPLKKYRIIKKFGKYKDPVYGIELFNESVELKPIGNGRVRAVFAGKIVYAQETQMLKKVVIIKHKNGLHTIYAHLDSIPSEIKNNELKWVQRGTTIGRVDELLKFQVTKKSQYVDPLKIIRK